MNLASDNTEIIESTPETTLTVRLKITMFMSRLIPKTLGIMNHEAYNIQSISDCFVLGLFLMHPWPFQTKDSHVHEVRKHRHYNIY